MRLNRLLLKHLLRILFAFTFIIVGSTIGATVFEYPSLTSVRWLVFALIALAGAGIGIAAPVFLEHGFASPKRTYIRSALQLLISVGLVIAGIGVGGEIAEARFWASLPPLDPTAMPGELGYDYGLGVGFAAGAAWTVGAAIGFFVGLITGVVLPAIRDYRLGQEYREVELLSLSLNPSKQAE